MLEYYLDEEIIHYEEISSYFRFRYSFIDR